LGIGKKGWEHSELDPLFMASLPSSVSSASQTRTR
jgi:hypothetical protein